MFRCHFAPAGQSGRHREQVAHPVSHPLFSARGERPRFADPRERQAVGPGGPLGDRDHLRPESPEGDRLPRVPERAPPMGGD